MNNQTISARSIIAKVMFFLLAFISIIYTAPGDSSTAEAASSNTTNVKADLTIVGGGGGGGGYSGECGGGGGAYVVYRENDDIIAFKFGGGGNGINGGSGASIGGGGQGNFYGGYAGSSQGGNGTTGAKGADNIPDAIATKATGVTPMAIGVFPSSLQVGADNGYDGYSSGGVNGGGNGGDASIISSADVILNSLSIIGGEYGRIGSGTIGKGGSATFNAENNKVDINSITIGYDYPNTSSSTSFSAGTLVLGKGYELNVKIQPDIPTIDIGALELNLSGTKNGDSLLKFTGSSTYADFDLTAITNVSLTGVPRNLAIGDKITLIDRAVNYSGPQTVYANGLTFNIEVTGNSLVASVSKTPYHRLMINSGIDNTKLGPYLSGDKISITANAAPSGKIFDKWISSGGGSFADASKASTTFTMPDKAVTLTATYKGKPVKVKLNAGKGFIYKDNTKKKTVKSKSKTVEQNAKYGKLPNAHREGYYFQGWYTKKSGGKKVTASSVMKSNKNTTLYAHYKENGKITKRKAAMVKAKPNNNSKTIGSKKKGKTIRVIGKVKVSKNKEWYKVKYGSKTGYIYSKYVKSNNPKSKTIKFK